MDVTTPPPAVAYAWRVGLHWYYALQRDLAPGNAVEMELITVDGNCVLQHRDADGLEIISGPKHFVPA